jgi:hypothetical protein
MNARSVMYFNVTKQYPLLRINREEVKGDNVFCPMCDDWHENNTFCQMSMEGGL